jgi:hypothetical protein
MKVFRSALSILSLCAAVARAQNSGSPTLTPAQIAQVIADAAARAATATGGAATGAASAVTVVVAIPVTPVNPTDPTFTGTPVNPGNITTPRIVPTGTTELPARTGETSINLGIGFGIRYVPPSRVTVAAGETLHVIAPQVGSAGDEGRYAWLKNGVVIPGANSSVLTIAHVLSADAGKYVWMYATPLSLPRPSQELILGVGQTNRLLNVSVRGTLAAGAGQSFTAGFIVGGGTTAKKMIVRAVGPTLTQFGVGSPLPRPVLRIFDSEGRPYANGYAYSGNATYDADLADSLAAVGAFPTPAGSADAVLLMPFVAGGYTAQVTSGDGSGGEVLVEIYEVP